MIAYTAKSAKALGFLKTYYNDVEVFVEDTSSYNMVYRIIAGILGSDVRLKSLNLLGPRKNVVDACKLDQADDNRRKLYVIDGDLDLINGRASPRLKHFYRLRSYCIENLLLTERALLEVAIESAPGVSPSNAAALLDFSVWQEQVVGHLMPLFIVYGVAYRLGLKFPTVSLGVYPMCEQRAGTHLLKKEKINSRVRALYRQIVKATNFKSAHAARQRISAIVRRGKSPARFISGKDYLLPITEQRLKHLFGYRGNIDQLRIRLAREYDPRAESQFARRLRKVAKIRAAR